MGSKAVADRLRVPQTLLPRTTQLMPIEAASFSYSPEVSQKSHGNLSHRSLKHRHPDTTPAGNNGAKTEARNLVYKLFLKLLQ